MTIQVQIDRRCAEIEAICEDKLGEPCRVRYTAERDRSGTTCRIGLTNADYLNLSGYGCKTLDDALDKALATAKALRTKADEDADLYAGLSVASGD